MADGEFRPGLLFLEEEKELMRYMSTKRAELVKEASDNPRKTFATVFAAFMYFSSTALTLVCGKLVYNSSATTARPGMFIMVTTCQAIATILWGVVLMLGRLRQSVVKSGDLCQPRFWLLCLPYSVGYFFVYYLAYAALEYVSGVAFVALMMARVNIDMFLEAFFLNRSSKASRVSAANMIMVCAIVHMLTVPSSDVSSNLALGAVFGLVFNIVSSVTYAYIPWLLNRGYEDMLSLAFATSAQQAVGGLAAACAENGGFSGLFDGFAGYQPWILVGASLLLDSSCLFGLKYLSPLAITLLGGAMQIPVMLSFEVVHFKAPLEAAYLASAVAVLASVVSFTITDRQVKQLAKENEPQGESAGISNRKHTSDGLVKLHSEAPLQPVPAAEGATEGAGVGKADEFISISV